jgi:nitrogen fixation protein NifX
MKVAFATKDGEHVEGDLRRASRVVIYDVSSEGVRFERACSFEGGPDRSEARIQALSGSAIVYVGAIGPSGAARLAARGIQAGTAPDGTSIEELLRTLERLVASRPDDARCA